MISDTLPVPLPGPGVCTVCGASSTTYSRCSSCNQITRALGFGNDFPVPDVLPLGLAIKKSQLALDLWNYKRSPDHAERFAASTRLARIIDERLPHVVEHVGIVDIVSVVPSRKSRTSPVRGLLEKSTWGSSNLIVDTLDVLDYELDTHTPDPERFEAHGVSRQHVLLIDDTFTRGATSLSAARALYDAGASHVTIVVVGRHADVNWMTPEYLATINSRGDHREFCPRCNLVHGSRSKSDLVTESESLTTTEPDARWASTSDELAEWESDLSAYDHYDPWDRPTQRPRSSANLNSGEARPADGGFTQSAGQIGEEQEPAKLSKTTAIILSAILAAPFVIVFILPSMMSRIGISLGTFNRHGGLWGPDGASVFAKFMVIGLVTGGFNWLLTRLSEEAAVAVFFAAVIVVTVFFVTP